VTIRNGVAVAVLLGAAAGTCFAQAGADTYKAKCQMCHGAAGMADSPAGKSMKVKPVTDPSVKGMDEAKMVAAVKNGMGKMQPYAGKLTDAQINDAVKYFRSFIK
jgi:mono/diheme cytochrome c family protein